jgi:hypothetical protein
LLLLLCWAFNLFDCRGCPVVDVQQVLNAF